MAEGVLAGIQTAEVKAPVLDGNTDRLSTYVRQLLPQSTLFVQI